MTSNATSKEFESTKVIFKDFVNEGEVPIDTFLVEKETVAADSLEDGAILVELLYLSVVRLLMQQHAVQPHSGSKRLVISPASFL
jgi:hypothetical protein